MRAARSVAMLLLITPRRNTSAFGSLPYSDRATAPTLLNNDLLLLRIHSTLRRLRCHCNHSFASRQRWREVMERAVIRHHWNFPSIHHHPRTHLRFPRHFNDVPMLNEGIQFQVDRFRLLALRNDGETILLALHRFLPRRFIRLYHPVVRSLAQA